MTDSAASENNFLCWTYAGVLDDMVQQYPWPGLSSNKSLLDTQLVYSVVTGKPLLINDGYLVLNPECLQSLHDSYSPLRVLIRKGYLKILSRNKSRSLEEMVLESAAHGIPTYRRLVDNRDQWSITQNALRSVDKDLKKQDCFAGWPRVDLTSSYLALVQQLARRPLVEQKGHGLGENTFHDVVYRFEDALGKDPSKPRSKWETIVMQHVQDGAARQSLMQTANEIYHHNFGVALSGKPPVELEGCEIGVLSKTSSAFANLYRSYSLDPSKLINPGSGLPDVPQIELPKRVDYSKRGILEPMFYDDTPVGQERSTYLKARKSFLEGSLDRQDLLSATYQYQRVLNDFLLHDFDSRNIATHAASFSVSAGTLLLAHNHFGDTEPLSIGVGLLTYFATDFLLSRLEFLAKADRLIDALPKILGLKTASRPKEWSEAIGSSGTLTALPVDSLAARELVGHLPTFS